MEHTHLEKWKTTLSENGIPFEEEHEHYKVTLSSSIDIVVLVENIQEKRLVDFSITIAGAKVYAELTGGTILISKGDPEVTLYYFLSEKRLHGIR